LKAEATEPGVLTIFSSGHKQRKAMIKKVLIVGGGIGGLSTAIALRRANITVDLVEIQAEWKVYHVGIVVQGNFRIGSRRFFGNASPPAPESWPICGIRSLIRL
jgi:putative NAD(P)-binding protein